MSNKRNLGLILSILALSIISGNGQRIKQSMYEKFEAVSSCYRRMNATHQIGCSSKRGGSTGVIHYCQTQADLDFILSNGIAGPYIPILPSHFFTAQTVDNMIKSEKISGLIIFKNETKYFTHENSCPNPRSSLSGTCKENNLWNPHGTGLLYRDIPFPVFYMDKAEELEKIRDCFDKFNSHHYDHQAERSLCSLELKSFMFATSDTPTCIRRSNIVTNLNPTKFCDPLGDSNIWSALYPLVKGNTQYFIKTDDNLLRKEEKDIKPLKGFKYIVVAARMDTTSMFERTAGANSPVTGIVTLLSVAKLLKSMVKAEDIENAKKNVLFILFNGETYDYIGSQRFLYDMQKGNFPVEDLKEDNEILPIIKPEDVDLFVELSQLGNSKGELFVHHLNENSKISGFFGKLSKHSKNSSVSFKNVPESLPPASLHTFLKNNSNFPGLIIADHEHSYSNNFYNSIYDNAENINFTYYNSTDGDNEEIPVDSLQKFVANLTEAISKSLYEEITQKSYEKEVLMDSVLINELFNCYLKNRNCSVFQSVLKLKPSTTTPADLYVGVDHVSNTATHLTSLTLGWFTGDVEGKGDINCTNTPRNYAFRYYNMSKSIYEPNVTLCYKITMNLTDARSPAFDIEGYDWSSGLYSTWTESTWLEIGVRMFLKPSAAHENTTMAIGSASLILSFAVVYFVKSRSHIMFSPLLTAEMPADC